MKKTITLVTMAIAGLALTLGLVFTACKKRKKGVLEVVRRVDKSLTYYRAYPVDDGNYAAHTEFEVYETKYGYDPNNKSSDYLCMGYYWPDESPASLGYKHYENQMDKGWYTAEKWSATTAGKNGHWIKSGGDIKPNYVCSEGPWPLAKVHCLTNSGGAKAPCRYNNPDIIKNTWVSTAYGFCITYEKDGSATVRYSGGGSKTIKWGILISADGKETPTGDGRWYVVNEGIGSPHYELIPYHPTQIKLGDGTDYKNNVPCPY